MLLKAGWITFFRCFPLPEILATPLKQQFRFLLSPGLCDPHCSENPSAPPLPSFPGIGRVVRIAHDDLDGTKNKKGTHRIWECIHPHYPVQVVPELGIECCAKGVKFSGIRLQAYLHPLGLITSLRMRVESDPPSGQVEAFRLANILENLERNGGLRVTTREFNRVHHIVALFRLLRDRLANKILVNSVTKVAPTDIFCVFSPEGGDYPSVPRTAVGGSPEERAAFAVLERIRTAADAETRDLEDKRFITAGMPSPDGETASWIFGSRHGLAFFMKPTSLKDVRAILCNHKNTARLLGFYRLFQSYLATPSQQLAGVDKAMLQYAVDASDKIASQYPSWWLRWGRATLKLEDAVRAAIKIHGLLREGTPDDHRPLRAFISYSHKDKKTREQMDVMLQKLQQEKILDHWDDAHLLAGQVFDDEIKRKIRHSHLFLMLVSKDLLASKYCKKELTEAIRAQKNGRVEVLPIILDNCRWRNRRFSKFNILLAEKPLKRWPSPADAFATVAGEIRAIALRKGVRPVEIKQEPVLSEAG